MHRRLHYPADRESVRSPVEPGETDSVLDRSSAAGAEDRVRAEDRPHVDPTAGAASSGEIREAALGYVPGLIFRLDPQLSDRLRLAAYAQRRTPTALAAELLRSGLEREAVRDRAEAALAILTPREREVARLTVRGCTNREIARALVISPETVKTHMRNLLGKFALPSKAELRLRLQELDRQP